MLFNPSTAPAGVLSALAQLDTHPDFQEFLNYLRSCRAGERELFESTPLPDMAAFGRQQGRVNVLSQMIEMTETARTRLLSRAKQVRNTSVVVDGGVS